MSQRPFKPPFYRAPKPVKNTLLVSSQRFTASASKASEDKLMQMAAEYLVLTKSDNITDFSKSTALLNSIYGLFGHYRTDRAIQKLRDTMRMMTL